ncbi:cell division protein FtsQ/DivIB [Yoonia sediminilitoris]|uniref:Cell division protein FtsQ n=1 Tax=Yoonia sediminilitoris TaxID=1286148 RepID=A0A2T6KQK8_9RHOB|nr:cell division protein FtsQ/DivIB [Yoonia sediminilitoris]PUB18832.1 cell division protein FtsQ [Yoonia sediminilitoris]RCW99000.1 cell division protein FtsQ [Yoonia sediminilitoris]
MRSLIRRRKKDVPYDPAPSRLGYRYQRLMLTPGIRTTMRIGVPVLLIAAISASYFAHSENRAALTARIEAAKRGFQERPQFMVQELQITGVAGALASDVADVLPLTFPVSSFELDLEGMRKAAEALEAVKSARVRVGQDGALEVHVSPRVPVALWRDANVLRLIDADGVVSGRVQTRSERLDLPLIAGDGAEQHIAQALALFNGTGPLRDRVRGVVRMGERRWDIVLDRDQRILLPAEGPVAALNRIIALNSAQDMLKRDVVIVDMRNAQRPTLRMSEEASLAMRRGVEIQINNGADE